MVSRGEWLRVGALSVLILIVINLPYALAYLAGEGHVFGGILFAVADGHSYLAKMRQGLRGEWLGTLPYTAEPGPSAFLFTYHLFLGHLARWTQTSVELIYHLARLVTGAAFLLTAYHLIARFMETPRQRLFTWLFFALSSGLGWLLLPWMSAPPDFWIAESIPFLTLLFNAHFPLAWTLLLWILDWSLPRSMHSMSLGSRLLGIALAATVLAQAQPMTLLAAGAVAGGLAAWDALTRRIFDWRAWAPILTLGMFGAPWVGYYQWLTQTHAQLQWWNAQNVTLSPAPWQALFWGGVPLALAAFGVRPAARTDAGRVVLIWLIIGLGLLYAPFAFQRRMSIGLWMPICLLAAPGVRDVIWPRLAANLRPLVVPLVALAAVLSNALLLLAAIAAVLARSPDIFLTRAEAQALAVLPPGALVIASPELSVFIPSRTDARVMYGHPMETVEAPRARQALEDFYAGRSSLVQEADFIIYGPREAALGPLPSLPSPWHVIFQQDDVSMYGR